MPEAIEAVANKMSVRTVSHADARARGRPISTASTRSSCTCCALP